MFAGPVTTYMETLLLLPDGVLKWGQRERGEPSTGGDELACLGTAGQQHPCPAGDRGHRQEGWRERKAGLSGPDWD